MKDDNANEPRPKRRRRRLFLLLALLALPVVAVLAFPWALSSRAGRVWLLGQANRVLAPGRLELSSLRFSWFGPTRMTGFVLRDRSGDRVVDAPEAVLDRSLRQLLFERPRLGTLRLDRAAIDAERLPDGSIDLYETLRPVIGLDPRTALRIEVPDGRLLFHGEGLAEPVVADQADVNVAIAPVPGPIGWHVRLEGRQGAAPNSLEVDGRYFRGLKPEDRVTDVEVRLAGRAWPWAIGGRNVRASGRLDGKVEAVRTSGLWGLKGEATLGRVEATGPLLAGDTLRVDRARGVWDVADSEGGWAVRALELDSPLATLKAEGPSRLVGRLDLAALVAQLPHALRLKDGVTLEKGTADVRVESRKDGGTRVVDVSGKVSDLRARDRERSFTLNDPATLTARLRRDGETFAVERLTAETPYFHGEARGGLTTGVSFGASLDLAGFQEQFRDVIDFGAVEVAGQGELKGRYKAEHDRFRGGVTAALKKVRLKGVGPWDVARDEVTLTAGVGGAADGSGWPRGWDDATTRLATGAISADLSARSNGPQLTWVVTGPVHVGAHPGRAEGRFEARGEGKGFVLDRVDFSLRADAKDEAPSPLALTTSGRFDPGKGTLTLLPRRAAEGPDSLALSPEGIRISGLASGAALRVDGGLVGDVAALAGWFPSAPERLRGRWAASASGRSGAEGVQLAARLNVDGLAWGDPAPDEGLPAGLAVRALVPNGGDRIELNELVLTSRHLTVEAAGKVDNPGGKAVAGLAGTVTPNWDAVSDWLAAHVEPGARVEGRPRDFRVRVPLDGGWAEHIDGEAGVVIDAADVYGMHLGATRVVVRARDGSLSIDPIDAALNGGVVHLEPSYRAAGAGVGPAVVLGKGSSLTDARVNDEVSQRVLSYVAPVLNNATRVNGLVSATIEEGVFPLKADDRKALTVKGAVVFQDVRFTPGGFFREVMDMFNAGDVSLVKIDEPVGLEIADRRVYQRGLVIPLGKISQVEMDGWVGFDRELNLRVSVPILPTILAGKPVVGGIAANSRVRIPIRGSLDQPQIDKDAFKVGMKELGISILEQGIGQGAADLFRLFNRPRDPNAPPPPPRITPEERKARRQEKKAERRLRRGLPP